VLAELALRLALPEAKRWYIWPPNLDTRFDVDASVFPGIGPGPRLHVNSLGLRGSEIPGGASRRVIAIGGSTTECLYLDQEKTWPALVERGWNERDLSRITWTGNAGRSGHTVRENILQLDELVRAIPEIDVVLVLPGINDLSKRLAQGDAYDADLFARPGARDAVRRTAFSVHPLGVDTDAPLCKRTALWRLVSSLRRRLEAGRRSTQGPTELGFVRWREHRSAASRWIDALPDLARALDEYRRNLSELVDIAQRSGARIVLATQPMLWRVDLPPEAQRLLWMGGVGDFQDVAGCAYYTLRALIEAMKRYNDVVRDVARARGVACVDLARFLDGDASAFYDDCHFTEHGAELVASAWLDVLAPRSPPR
jgi:lysophospholipase L1-like esterase